VDDLAAIEELELEFGKGDNAFAVERGSWTDAVFEIIFISLPTEGLN
jgi:hypothetical protein